MSEFFYPTLVVPLSRLFWFSELFRLSVLWTINNVCNVFPWVWSSIVYETLLLLTCSQKLTFSLVLRFLYVLFMSYTYGLSTNLWSTFMLPTDSATYFFGTKVVSTDSSLNFSPEIVQRPDFFLLLSLAIFESRWSMLSNRVNRTLHASRARDETLFSTIVWPPFRATAELKNELLFKLDTNTMMVNLTILKTSSVPCTD